MENGRNIVSLYCTPLEPDAEEVFGPCDSLVLVKDNGGNQCWPGLVNHIGDIDVTQGYQLFAGAQDSLTILGIPVDVSATVIALETGWNIMAYLKKEPENIDTALAAIASRITLVKDNAGNQYWPGLYNGIGDMQPGQGYQIYMSEAADFTYAVSGESADAGAPIDKSQSRLVHFTFTDKTGNNMSVLIPDTIQPTVNSGPLDAGDEIGVFSPSGLCVGAVVWDGSTTALTVWGENSQTTDTVDGMQVGEQLGYRIWDSSEDSEFPAIISYSSGGPDYSVNGIAILGSLEGIDPPVITTEPQFQTKYTGESVTFFIEVTGAAPIAYQWKKNGGVLSGAIDSILTVPTVALTDAGDYTCVASNAIGSVESAPATLNVLILPTITVTTPNGAESWEVGAVKTISWTSTGAVDSVKVEYSTDAGGTWKSILDKMANTGSCPWVIPADTSQQCMVRVSNSVGGNPFDVSNALFAIDYPVSIPDSAEKSDTEILAECGIVRNPVCKDAGYDALFQLISKKDLTGGEFTVYDPPGNCISEKTLRNYRPYTRRITVSWDLRNREKRIVADGTYLGVLKVVYSDGSSEIVRKVIGIKSNCR